MNIPTYIVCERVGHRQIKKEIYKYSYSHSLWEGRAQTGKEGNI